MQIRFCHYYNNGVECPFEESGCMFSHAVSPQCWFKESCLNKLCPFRHDECTFMYNSSQDDQFEHVKTSTPIKEDIKCSICIKVIPTCDKFSKCEECDQMVCEDCAKKTYVEDEFQFSFSWKVHLSDC